MQDDDYATYAARVAELSRSQIGTLKERIVEREEAFEEEWRARYWKLRQLTLFVSKTSRTAFDLCHRDGSSPPYRYPRTTAVKLTLWCPNPRFVVRETKIGAYLAQKMHVTKKVGEQLDGIYVAVFAGTKSVSAYVGRFIASRKSGVLDRWSGGSGDHYGAAKKWFMGTHRGTLKTSPILAECGLPEQVSCYAIVVFQVDRWRGKDSNFLYCVLGEEKLCNSKIEDLEYFWKDKLKKIQDEYCFQVIN